MVRRDQDAVWGRADFDGAVRILDPVTCEDRDDTQGTIPCPRASAQRSEDGTTIPR